MLFEKIKGKVKEKNELILNTYIAFLILITILLSRNTLISMCILGFNKSFFISMLLYIPLFIIFALRLIKKKIQLKNIKIVLVMIGSIILSVLIKKDWQLYNISILYYIIISTILILMTDFNQFKKYYINILLFLAIFSLITTYVVKPLIFTSDLENEILNSKFIVTNSVGYKFLNLFFGFALFDQEYDRNYGIFTEPSYYQFYLIMAIVMLLFSKNKKITDWIKITILSYTVYTTKSAAGFIVFGFIILTCLLKYIINNRKNYKKICIIVVFISVIIIGLLAIPNVRNNINFIYNKITTENESSLSRLGSIGYTLNKFIQKPIVGNKISDILSYEEHLTNTTITVGAIYGVVPFLCVIYFTANFSMIFKEKKFICFCIFVIIILAYNSHVFVGVQSFWMLILLGLTNIKEKKYENTLDS